MRWTTPHDTGPEHASGAPQEIVAASAAAAGKAGTLATMLLAKLGFVGLLKLQLGLHAMIVSMARVATAAMAVMIAIVISIIFLIRGCEDVGWFAPVEIEEGGCGPEKVRKVGSDGGCGC